MFNFKSLCIIQDIVINQNVGNKLRKVSLRQYEKKISLVLLMLFILVYFLLSLPSISANNPINIGTDNTVTIQKKVQLEANTGILGQLEEVDLLTKKRIISKYLDSCFSENNPLFNKYKIYSLKINNEKDIDYALDLTKVTEAMMCFSNDKLAYSSEKEGCLKSMEREDARHLNIISIPSNRITEIIIFTTYAEKELTILQRNNIVLKEYVGLYKFVVFTNIFELSAFGGTVVFGLYFLISFFIYTSKDFSLIFLAIFNLLMGVRVLFSGNILISKLADVYVVENILKVNDALYSLALLSFLFFIDFTFKKEAIKKLRIFITGFTLIFVYSILFLLERDNPIYAVYGVTCTLVFVGYTFRTIIVASKKKEEGSRIILDSHIVLTAAVVNDTLIKLSVIKAYEIIPVSLLFLLLFLSIYFSIVNLGHLANTEKIMETLNIINQKNIKFNEAASKFVPIEFLHYLKKETISDIKLGDFQEFDMTVLFIDIRGFTKISEEMTPKQTFAFLNSYLKIISPAISKHGGFIDKYIGDAVMALFPVQQSDAVDAVLAVKENLLEYNIGRARAGYSPIKIGAGIHSGKLILGTIGSEYRMETTVISDAVNVSSRLENATKSYGENILISSEICDAVKYLQKYTIREVDYVKLRGKTSKTAIYSILDGDDRYDEEYLREYEKALATFKENDFSKALSMFNKLIDKNPLDKVAHIYKDRCRYADISGVPEDWGGFYDIV